MRALFRGTHFPPGVDADLRYKGAGSFHWNIRAIMWKGMQRQSRVPVCSFAVLVAAKWAVIKPPWCFFNPSMRAQIAFQQDTPLTPTFEHPLSLININRFINKLQLQSVSSNLSYLTIPQICCKWIYSASFWCLYLTMTVLITCSISKIIYSHIGTYIIYQIVFKKDIIFSWVDIRFSKIFLNSSSEISSKEA